MKPSLFFFALFFSGALFSQNTFITLSFNAKDSLNDSMLTFDSLKVTNINTGCDTTLYDSIPELNIEFFNPVNTWNIPNPAPGNFYVAYEGRNPFMDAAQLMIYTRESGNLLISAYDVMGRLLSQREESVPGGWNTFGIYTPGPKELIIRVSDKSHVQSIRLISIGTGASKEEIRYIGRSGTAPDLLQKSLQTNIFTYHQGDFLRYTAFISGYNQGLIEDNPQSDETYMFSLLPDLSLYLPQVITNNVNNIIPYEADAVGTVSGDGGLEVTQRGICWSTHNSPTIADPHTFNGGGTGTYTCSIVNLEPSIWYNVRAYAINSAGIAYGNELTFQSAPIYNACGDTLFYDDKFYGTIQIGNQCWFQNNLNVGATINYCGPQTDNGIIEKYCYDGDEANCDEYGGLYQWAEMVQYYNGATDSTNFNPPPTGHLQGICPDGWHLPTEAEWDELFTNLNGISSAGGKMKEEGTKHWYTPNSSATNESGFTALPAGLTHGGCYYDNLTFTCNYWTLTEIYTLAVRSYQLLNNSGWVGWMDPPKTLGVSVRCLKD